MSGYVRARGKRGDGSTKWQARWRHPTTQERRERTFRTRTLADRWIKTMDADALRGDFIDPRRSDQPFRVVAGAWRRSWVGLEPKTRAGYESILTTHLLPEFGDRRVSTITPERVEAYVRRLSDDGMAAGTVRSVYAALRAALNAAVRLRMIAANPCVGVKLPRAPQTSMLFLTAEEVAALADAIHPHFRVLIYTAAYTGLRAGELGALRRSDLDLLRSRLTVNQALKDLTGTRLPDGERGLTFGPTKTHARRSITLPAFLRDMLAEHLESRPAGAYTLVFTMPSGEPIRHANFYRRYFKPAVLGTPEVPAKPTTRGRAAVAAKPAVPAALPPDKQAVRFHDLRHTCAALLIAAGAHPKAIQERLGHKSITMTLDRYGHLLPGLGDTLADALDAAHTAAQAPAPTVVPLRRAEG
jgi:integrase